MNFWKALALGFVEVAESRGWAAPEAEPAAPTTPNDEDEEANAGFDDDAEFGADEEDDSSLADRIADREADAAAQEEAAAQENAAQEAASQEVASPRWVDWPFGGAWHTEAAEQAAAQEPTIVDARGRDRVARGRRGLRPRRSRLAARRRQVSGQRIDATSAAEREDASAATMESGEPTEPTEPAKPQYATPLAVVESGAPSEATPPKTKPQDAAPLAVVESGEPSEGTPPKAKLKPDYDLSTPRHLSQRHPTMAMAAANEHEVGLLQFVEWVEEHGDASGNLVGVEAVESTEPQIQPTTTGPTPADLHARVHVLEAEVQRLKAAQQGVDERIAETVREQVGAIVALFQETLAPLASLGEQIAEVEKRCVATDRKIGTVDRRVDSLVSGIARVLHSELREVEQKIGTVDRRVESVVSGVSGLLHSELREVDQRIDKLSVVVAHLVDDDEFDDADDVDEAYDADAVDEAYDADDGDEAEDDDEVEDDDSGAEDDHAKARPKLAEPPRKYFTHPLFEAPELTAADWDVIDPCWDD